MTGKMPSWDPAPAWGPAGEKGLAHRWGPGLWVLLRRCRKSRLQVTKDVGVKETEPLSSEAVTPRPLRWTHHPTWDTKTSTRTVKTQNNDRPADQTPDCVPRPQHCAGGRRTRHQKKLYAHTGTHAAQSTATGGGSVSATF